MLAQISGTTYCFIIYVESRPPACSLSFSQAFLKNAILDSVFWTATDASLADLFGASGCRACQVLGTYMLICYL